MMMMMMKVIENDTVQSGTHDFLLMFHSKHRPILHRFRDNNNNNNNNTMPTCKAP